MTQNFKIILCIAWICSSISDSKSHIWGDEMANQLHLQTNHGDIEFGFFPHVAPKTVEQILKLVRLGCCNTNHFFWADKGFVAQVDVVVRGRTTPMNDKQEQEADKTIVGTFSSVKHVRGILSVGRYITVDELEEALKKYDMGDETTIKESLLK